MKFIDDKSNKLSWWNRNYFYVGSFIVIALNILVFVICSINLETLSSNNGDKILDLHNLTIAFCSNFSHANWIHLFGNCFGVALAGLYLERKTGSINFLLLTLSGCILAPAFHVCLSMSTGAGFSGVTFFLFACLIVDYIFSFEKTRRNKTNIILGGILIAIIYLDQMSLDFNNGIQFYFWPYQLLTNAGHYSGFIAGIIVGLIINLTKLKMTKQSVQDLKVKVKRKTKKIVYTCVACFMCVVSIVCITLSVVANSRQSITANFFDQNNYSASYVTNKDNTGSLENCILEYLSTIDDNTDEYAVQVFTDSNFSQPKNVWIFPGKKGGGYSSNNQIYKFYNSHIPLAVSTEQNYYLKAFKCYGVSFTGNLTENFDYVKNLVEYTILPARYFYYANDFAAWNFVEQGKDFSFNLEFAQGRNVSVTYLNEQNESISVKPDQDGIYTIKNVSHDLVINLNY